MAFLSVLWLNLIQVQSREISKGGKKPQQNLNLSFCGQRILAAVIQWNFKCNIRTEAECRYVSYCVLVRDTLVGYDWRRSWVPENFSKQISCSSIRNYLFLETLSLLSLVFKSNSLHNTTLKQNEKRIFPFNVFLWVFFFFGCCWDKAVLKVCLEEKHPSNTSIFW